MGFCCDEPTNCKQNEVIVSRLISCSITQRLPLCDKWSVMWSVSPVSYRGHFNTLSHGTMGLRIDGLVLQLRFVIWCTATQLRGLVFPVCGLRGSPQTAKITQKKMQKRERKKKIFKNCQEKLQNLPKKCKKTQ